MRMVSMMTLALLGCGSAEEPTDDSGFAVINSDTGDTGTAVNPPEPWSTPTLSDACYVIVAKSDADGTAVNSTSSLIYDPDFPTLTYVGNFADPNLIELYSETSYKYDSNGFMSERHYDDYDPYYGESQSEYWVRDSDGNILQYDDDADGDGDIDSQHFTTRNASGLATEITVDNGVDGSIDERWTYILDPDERLTRIDIDLLDDGTIDDVWTFTYAAPSPSIDVERLVDEGNDGAPEEWIAVTYDDQQRIVTYERDDEADDRIDAAWVYTYGDTEDPLTLHGQFWQEGTDDGLYDFTWTYHDDGRMDTENLVYDVYGDGTFIYTWYDHWIWSCP